MPVSAELDERSLQSSKHRFVNDEDSFKPYALELSLRLNDTLKPFFESNNLLPHHGNIMDWLMGLNTVFIHSLKLKALVTLRSGRHDFRCPVIGDMCGSKLMGADKKMKMHGVTRIQIVFFPALVQMFESKAVVDGAREATLLYAVAGI